MVDVVDRLDVDADRTIVADVRDRPFGPENGFRASSGQLVDEGLDMKDFSLFYGPLKAWLPVAAIAVLAMVVFINQASGSEADCDLTASADCTSPLLGEPELLGNGDGLDVAPTGLPMEPTGDTTADDPAADDEPSPWDDFDPSDSEVPFVSLRPSPEPMTEAGEDLVRSTGSGTGDAGP